MPIAGIYKITSPTGRVYIGQSRNIKKRFSAYRLKRCEGQRKLFASLSKYGAANHSFAIVHNLPYDISQSVINDYEEVYMDAYKKTGVDLLNIREAGSRGKNSEETNQRNRESKLGKKPSAATVLKYRQRMTGEGNVMYGKTHSEASKKKMRLSATGRKNTKEATQKQIDGISKAIIQYDLKGVFIKEWKSATEAGKGLNLNGYVINNSCRGQRPTAYKFIWKFKNSL